MKIIDAEVAIDGIKKAFLGESNLLAAEQKAIQYINLMPIKHMETGHLIIRDMNESYLKELRCSHCNHAILWSGYDGIRDFHFCLKCGILFDREKDEWRK